MRPRWLDDQYVDRVLRVSLIVLCAALIVSSIVFLGALLLLIKRGVGG